MKPTERGYQDLICVRVRMWSYRGVQHVEQRTPMGHEYCGIIEE